MFAVRKLRPSGWWRIVLLAAPASGCVVSNPRWDGVGTGGTMDVAPSTSAAEVDGSSGDSSGGSISPGTSSGSTGGIGPGTTIVSASIAECLGLEPAVSAGPAECQSWAGPGQLLVDEISSEAGSQALHAYIRFDIAPIASTVQSVTLQLQVAENTGEHSGWIWLVESFSRADLEERAPAQLQLVAADINRPFEPGENVEWELDPSFLPSDASLYLGVIAGHSNGITYWNTLGVKPPQLVIVTGP